MVKSEIRIFLGVGFLQAGYSSVAQSGITTDLGLSVAQVRKQPSSLAQSLTLAIFFCLVSLCFYYFSTQCLDQS